MAEAYTTTTVTILGERYPIKSDTDAAYLHELARYVEDKIKYISTRTQLPSPLKYEVLASIIIADEYFSEKKKNVQIENTLSGLSGMIESVLDDSGIVKATNSSD
jgi:cell division protein ZapA (FtsZ GTPase activity inhibitor)